jgi:hypothetical protein
MNFGFSILDFRFGTQGITKPPSSGGAVEELRAGASI